MSFEVYMDAGVRTQEFISITEAKTFGLSRAFLNKYGITSDHKVVILYDAETSRVGLHFTGNAPKFASTLRITNPKHGGNVAAKSFFEAKGIDTRKYAGRYNDFERIPLNEIGIDKEGTAFVIKLRENEDVESSKGASHEAESDASQPISLDDIPF